MKKLPLLIIVLSAISILLIGVIFFLFIDLRFVQITGNAMSPTLIDGKYCIAYNIFDKVNRDDSVIVTYDNQIIVSRVIGMPGDTITNNNGSLTFKSIVHPTASALMPECTIPINTSIILKDDEYFLLGDNEAHSLDSRYPEFGIIKRPRIVSKIGICW